MDFVETETGTSVDVSDRFIVYGGINYMVSGGPTRLLHALSQAKKPSCKCFEQETYLLNELQIVTIEDTKAKHKGANRFLSFEVPKQSGGTPMYSVQQEHLAHISFDE